MQPETSLLQRLATGWSPQRSLLLINPPDAPADYFGLPLNGVLHDRFDQYQRWEAAQSEALPVWFATHLERAQMPPSDVVIMFLPKGKARLQAQLLWLAAAAPGLEIVLIGAIKAGIKSAGKLMSLHCHQVRKLDAARHCQALVGTLQQPEDKPEDEPEDDFDSLYADWQINADELIPAGDDAAGDTQALPDLAITTLPGVFASGHLDAGSRLLLQRLIAAQSSLPRTGTLLDYGCGCGVLAAVAHRLLPNLKVTAVDTDAWALAAARKTLADAEAVSILPSASASDIGGSYELIISNPPFHRQFQHTTTITASFLQQLPQLLSRHGQCWLVANRFLPYERMLTNTGMGYEQVAATSEFKVVRIARY
jgi:16S rRNA (guanine1207-N2)-methyltransferase